MTLRERMDEIIRLAGRPGERYEVDNLTQIRLHANAVLRKLDKCQHFVITADGESFECRLVEDPGCRPVNVRSDPAGFSQT